MQELHGLHADLHSLSPEQASRRRQRNQRLVCKLAPGRSCVQYAMDLPSGGYDRPDDHDDRAAPALGEGPRLETDLALAADRLHKRDPQECADRIRAGSRSDLILVPDPRIDSVDRIPGCMFLVI